MSNASAAISGAWEFPPGLASIASADNNVGKRPLTPKEMSGAVRATRQIIWTKLVLMLRTHSVEDIQGQLAVFWTEYGEMWMALRRFDGNLKQLTPEKAEEFYPREEGRHHVRASLYVFTDVLWARENGKIGKDLLIDSKGFFDCAYPLWLAVAAARDAEVSGEMAEHICSRFLDLVCTGLGGGKFADTLIEDAWLKAASDEARLEQGDEPYTRCAGHDKVG